MLDYLHQQQWSNGFGDQQSPIEITTSKLKAFNGQLPFEPQTPYALHLEIDDGTTIRLTGTGEAEIFHRQFDFQQVHFHSESEHVIDGNHFPMEIHLVHQNAIGQLVVVALMVDEGAANPQFQEIIDHFSHQQSSSVTIDITNWLPQDPMGFHYLGSLTTPPLTEGVEWLLITNPKLTLSHQQINWFRQTFHKDNREIQKINNRPISWYK